MVVLLFFVCLWFRDDLPKFLDHTCPCTLLLFTAYAIVRTEPSATSAKPEEKKKSVFASKCMDEYHAGTAALCDLGDPGWGDPRFPHGAFVASITRCGPLVCFCSVLFCVLFWAILRMTHKMSSCMEFQLLVAILSLSFFGRFCLGVGFGFCLLFGCFFGLCCL